MMSSKKKDKYVACSVDQVRDHVTHRCVEVKKEAAVAKKKKPVIAKRLKIEKTKKKAVASGRKYRCCVMNADGKTRCKRMTSVPYGMCDQHKKLQRKCSFLHGGKVVKKEKEETSTLAMLPRKVQPELTNVYDFRIIKGIEIRLPLNKSTCKWPENIYKVEMSKEELDAEAINAGISPLNSPTEKCRKLGDYFFPSNEWIRLQQTWFNAAKDTKMGGVFGTSLAIDNGDRPLITFIDFIRIFMIDSMGIEGEWMIDRYDPSKGIIQGRIDPTAAVNRLMRSSVPVDRDFYVWRAVQVHEHSVGIWKRMLDAGRITHHKKSPISTSIDSRIAMNFISCEGEYGCVGGILMRIKIPKGSKGALPVSKLFKEEEQMSDENEITLPGNSVFTVTKISRFSAYNFIRNDSTREQSYRTIELLRVDAVYS